MAPVHTGTKTEVARISKNRHRLANFGAWQGSWEYSESTPCPPLQALLKAGLWVSDREDVEAHRTLLVRPVLNPAVEVSGGEVAKVNVGKGSESGIIWAYNGSVTVVPNEIKMLRYNLVIVEVPRRGGWIPLVRRSCVCFRKGYLASFMDTLGIWLLWNNTYVRNWKICTQQLCAYHLGRREESYLLEQPTLLLVKTHGLGPAVPHFLTQKSFIEGLWLGLAILWWLLNLLEDPNDDSDDTHMDVDASRCLWALYYGHRRPDLISLGCIHLPVPFNCAWGVLSDGPYNVADVMNLLKTSVRKGDTEEDVEWRSVMNWASTGQPLLQEHESPDQAADPDTSESGVEVVPDPQTPIPKGKTDKQRQKEQEKAERELRKQEEAWQRQRKKEKGKGKKAKEDERANRKREEEEDKLATAAAAASPSQKKRAVEGLQASLQHGVRVGLSKSNGKSNGK